jgi:hypothetical protein
MRSPQSQEARQSDRQARNLRITIVGGLLVLIVIGGAILWWPDAPTPEPVADAPVATGEEGVPALVTSAGEALKDQGSVTGYTVVPAEKALDLTLPATGSEDARAVAQATCDSLQGKIEGGWTVRVRPAGSSTVTADCAI